MNFDIFDKIIRGICNVVLAVVMVIGFTMLGVSWAHVFFRYVMNDSLTWSEELLKILIVWFCLLSATFISVRREHIGIVIFKQLFPKKLEKFCDLFVSFMMFAATVFMCYYGWTLCQQLQGRRFPALKILRAWGYSALWVSFGIMAIYELRNFLVDVFAPGRPPALNDPLAPIVDAPESESPDVTAKGAAVVSDSVK